MNARVALGLTDSERATALFALAEEAGDMTVVAAPQSSDEVVAVLARTEIEVLVLDEELGPLPVLELARQLQEKHPAVGLLLLAARDASPDLLRQTLRAGFRDVLSGPLTVEALADAMCLHGIPENIRCDNGPEMISKALRKWVAKTGPQIQYIAPGSPWENGYCESFNGKFKDECLKQEIFYSLKEAQTVIGLWQNAYNRVRPHSSLGYRPPAPVTFPDLAFRLPMASGMQ